MIIGTVTTKKEIETVQHMKRIILTILRCFILVKPKEKMGLSYFMWFLKYLILDLIVRSADEFLI